MRVRAIKDGFTGVILGPGRVEDRYCIADTEFDVPDNTPLEHPTNGGWMVPLDSSIPYVVRTPSGQAPGVPAAPTVVAASAVAPAKVRKSKLNVSTGTVSESK